MELSAQTLDQTFYFDFGSITAAQGDKTEGADSNGNYWNNITNNTAGNKYAAAGTVYDSFVNSANEPSQMTITLNSRFSTNGKSNGGGLLNPDANKLGDLAVATATEDYFFIEKSENNSNFTIKGLNPDHGYKFHIFASRNASQTRTGAYTMEGLNSFKGNLTLAGSNIGGSGVNQNVDKILVSDLVYPDDNGQIIFTVGRAAGDYIAINAMKVEEFVGGQRPVADPVITAMTLKGSAAENGQSLALRRLAPDGKPSKIFVGFAALNAGDYTFEADTEDGATIKYGVDTSGRLAKDSPAATIAADQLSMIRVDMSSRSLTITPITSMTLVGSVCPNGWNLSGQPAIDYVGNGVWSATVDLDRVSTASDPERFIFVMNNSWDYSFKRVAKTSNDVGLASDGYAVEDIRLNHGTYTITLDMANGRFDIERPDGIDENRISVMGSSVANGEGATDHHGYAYLYGELLKDRAANGRSQNPFYTSGISINGNNTVNLLDRYHDLTNDFGRYVIFGVSLGNEGIHGAADQQKIFNQFRDNMLTLIEKAREDGKTPVIMNNYTRGDFEASDYDYVKQMNLLIHQWDLPSVNLLGAIDNGAGRWADGYQNGDDIYHPSTAGHEEFLYAMVPSLFDAIADGKPLPIRSAGNSFILGQGGMISFVPEETSHAFTLAINLNNASDGLTTTIANTAGDARISIENGAVVYTSPQGKTITANSATAISTTAQPTAIALTHYYAQGRTLLYVDGQPAGEIAEKIAPTAVKIADNNGAADISEIFYYRSAMSPDEIKALNEGKMLKSSLEVYMPFSDETHPETNVAQSLNTVIVNKGQTSVGQIKLPDTSLVVTTADNQILIATSAPTQVNIHSIDGRSFFASEVDGEIAVGLQAGIYLVNNQKVIVK